ncbi:hypothetical protein CEXT_396351 [Caerostris extrusa]|uniref:Maturase K n=1 Tax=Caerostris extrusa TaxID=172846 RepID=A0AAV4QJL0_CAEEX|nr:hypothetical protein CEXT_396351 [Caerostris extrusa]
MRRGPCFLPAKDEANDQRSLLSQIAVDPAGLVEAGSLIDLVPIFSSSPIPIISIYILARLCRNVLYCKLINVPRPFKAAVTHLAHKKKKEFQFLCDLSSISFKLSQAGFAPPFHKEFFFSTVESDEAWVAFPLHFISDPNKQGNLEALEGLLSDEAWVASPLHFISDPNKQGNLRPWRDFRCSEPHKKKREGLEFLSDLSSILFRLSHAGFAPHFHERIFFSTVGPTRRGWRFLFTSFLIRQAGNLEALEGLLVRRNEIKNNKIGWKNRISPRNCLIS